MTHEAQVKFATTGHRGYFLYMRSVLLGLGWLAFLGCGGSDNLSQAPDPPVECFDGNPCTIDERVSDQECSYTPRPDGYFACDGKDTVLGCFGGELRRDNALDLLVQERNSSNSVWGYTGCLQDDDGLTVGTSDPRTSFPFPVCVPGDERCHATDLIVDFFYGECRTFNTSTGMTTEPLWDLVRCDEYCQDQGFSGSSGCTADDSDCACQ